MLAAIVVGAASYCFETGILVKKQTKYLLYVATANLSIKILLNLALIPFLGILGAAIAYFVTSLIQATLVNHFSQRLYPVTYPYGAMWRIGIMATVTYAASLGIDYRHLESSVPLKLGLVAAYLGALFAVDKEIRQVVMRGLARIRPNRL